MEAEKTIRMARATAEEFKGFVVYVARRFVDNGLTEVAASLTFTTLLALVPLMAIGFAVLAAFPAFGGMEARLEAFIFENFVPHASDAVRNYLGAFRDNVGRLSAVGIVGLGVTALMMLMTIEKALNRVFRVRRARPLVRRLLAYWALLTVGPVLFLLSLTLTSALAASAHEMDLGFVARQFARILPLLVTFAGYLTVFTVMPNRPVLLRHAAVGASVAAVLFEVLKALFGLYVTAFPTYQTIYGTLSVLPILLIWIDLSWIVTLGGAGIVAAMPEWQGRGGVDADNAPRIGPLATAIEILRLLRRAHDIGEAVHVTAFIRRLRVAPHVLEDELGRLQQAGYAIETRHGRWVLGRRLDELTVYDLMLALRLQLRQPHVAGGPVPGLEGPVDTAIAAERKALDVPLLKVLDGGGATPVKLAAE